jgi:hypothetical protein
VIVIPRAIQIGNGVFEFSFADMGSDHKVIESGRSLGKLVLAVWSEKSFSNPESST